MNGQCHGKGDKLINIGHIYILADLDIGNYRQPHLKPNVRVKPTYVRAGEGHMRQGLQGQADSSHQGTDGEVVVVDSFHIALFSALEQTHCARMSFYTSD